MKIYLKYLCQILLTLFWKCKIQHTFVNCILGTNYCKLQYNTVTTVISYKPSLQLAGWVWLWCRKFNIDVWELDISFIVWHLVHLLQLYHHLLSKHLGLPVTVYCVNIVPLVDMYFISCQPANAYTAWCYYGKSVRLSHCDIVPKQLHISSKSFHHLVGAWVYFWPL